MSIFLIFKLIRIELYAARKLLRPYYIKFIIFRINFLIWLIILFSFQCKFLKWADSLSLNTEGGNYLRTHPIFVIMCVSINFDGNNDIMFIVSVLLVKIPDQTIRGYHKLYGWNLSHLVPSLCSNFKQYTGR